MLHTSYIIKSIKNKQIINLNINQISSIFDVTYSLHLSNQSKTNKLSSIQYQSNFINIWCYIHSTFIKSIKTNQNKQIIIDSISIKFHQYLMLHTSYIYQIDQINQKQTNYHQFEYQSNFINIWCYILPTFINTIKNKLSSIWISIKFHQYLMLHTSYIYQINQKPINQIIININ
jgi:hypothetical protein